MDNSSPRFQTVSQAARTLKISRRTVQRNVPRHSKFRTKEGLVDIEKLRQKLLIGAPYEGLRKSGYPVGVPRETSGLRGKQAWAQRRKKRQYLDEKLKRQRGKKTRRKKYPICGIPFTIEGIVLRFMGWLNWVSEGDPFESWDIDRLRLLQRRLRPIEEFLEWVSEIITQKSGLSGKP